jgi:hypothetical protein
MEDEERDLGPEDSHESETEQPEIEEPSSEEAPEVEEDTAGDQPEEEQGKLLSPAQRRIQQEIGRRRAIEQELANTRRQHQEMLRERAELQAQVQRRQAYDPAERQRQLEMMEPEQRFQFLLDEKDREYKAHLGRLEYMMVSQNDQTSFQTYLAGNPEYKKYEPEVERLFNEAVSRGQPQSRNAILSWTIGEEARQKKVSALAKARKNGEDNIRRATTKPIGGRSSISPGDNRKMTAEERLFRNLEKGAYNL